MRASLLLLCACSPVLMPATVESDGGLDTGFIGEEQDWCASLDRSRQPQQLAVDTWVGQDLVSKPGAGQVVVMGDATVRRWEGGYLALASRGVVQRGMGGARMVDVAQHTPALVSGLEPAAVVVSAGAEDIALGATAEQVVTDFRCVVQQVRQDLGRDVPVVFVGLTPTPVRWANWQAESEVNAAIKTIAGVNQTVFYADVPSRFLASGQPPDSKLFVFEDAHLSEQGYRLWQDALLPAVFRALPDARPLQANPEHPASGAIVRVDLGPSNQQDGVQASADGEGAVWNTWHAVTGGQAILAGERLAGLKTTAGVNSGMSLVVSGGFRAYGLQNGGLTNPSKALLGDLAYDAATADFFYTEGPDDPGSLTIQGLDTTKSYTLRLFASSQTVAERRISSFVVTGVEERETGLTTSGRDVGNGGYDGNNQTVAVVASLVPDAAGQIHVDVDIAGGDAAYLNLLEIAVD